MNYYHFSIRLLYFITFNKNEGVDIFSKIYFFYISKRLKLFDLFQKNIYIVRYIILYVMYIII